MDKIILFQKKTDKYKIPKKFTFPFYYSAHELAKLAAEELQYYLQTQNDFDHPFGFSNEYSTLEIGKMFGVLVVQTKNGDLAYLSAFSGKLANSNHHKRFVPPVFDLLTEQGFFKKEEKVLNDLNNKIEKLINSDEYKNLNREKTKIISLNDCEIIKLKSTIKENKKIRDLKRQNILNIILNNQEKFIELKKIDEESKKEQIKLKELKKDFKNKLCLIQEKLEIFNKKIKNLQSFRAEKSMELQKKIFRHYTFKNALLQEKSLLDIFKQFKNELPPAGAGECAAPKLLQYAFLNGLKPICMAEFWWGKSPLSEVRKHGQFYPSCKSKCEPILTFMMEGLEVEENPFLQNENQKINYQIIYEDEQILAINKPENCLSVPGKMTKISIYNQIKLEHPDWTGPLLIHRLDYSTSGLLLIAKNLETYKKIQKQFIKRSIQKNYIAIIDGIIEKQKGTISLPLRVDLEDRPRQIVCEEFGKIAITEYKVLEYKNGKTKILFTPITGRTHQLRVHSAHHLGLNTPILGDDLYGNVNKRLYLHSSKISFYHPLSNEKITLECKADF